MRGVQAEDEEGLGDPEAKMLRMPVLVVGGEKDGVCLADLQIESTKKWAVGGFKHMKLPCGHWPMLEMREEVDRILEECASEA
ncbi:MAG: hypothetical protein MMC23_007175 [Stictis urceolatum]|nr:hypothetical protein [Stictis urceolata]